MKEKQVKLLGDIVIFDKRFKGISRDIQKNIVSFIHVSAEELKKMKHENGTIKLLSTGLFTGYTTKELASNYINKGEVITIPTGGTANIKYHNGEFVDSGNILCVSKYRDIDIKFVYYALLYNKDYIESCYKGTGIKHPYMPDIWNIPIPIPSITEQQSIVIYINSQFAKIDAIKANAEKQLQEAKTLFQNALKDLLTPKEGWINGILYDIAYIIHGKSQKEVLNQLGEYPIYGSGGNIMGYAIDYLCDGKEDVNDLVLFSEEILKLETEGLTEQTQSIYDKIYYYDLNNDGFIDVKDATYMAMYLDKVISDATLKQFKVTFLDANGNVLDIQYVDAFDDAEISDPTIDGYTFIGWDKDFTNVTSDIVVKAIYSKN